jgi:hypothetical protein
MATVQVTAELDTTVPEGHIALLTGYRRIVKT